MHTLCGCLKKSLDTMRLELQVAGRYLMWVPEPDSSPLQEKQALLIAEPCVLPLF